MARIDLALAGGAVEQCQAGQEGDLLAARFSSCSQARSKV
jgi:hypothetical protein